MPATTDDRLLVLHTLRLGGFASAEKVAARTGLADVEAMLAELAADGLAVERTGRISGWSPTPAGRAALAGLLADELAARDARAAVQAADTTFAALNDPFKALCTRWQLRPDGTPNDHSDAAYDAAAVADLAPLHEAVRALTARLAATLPRFGRYPAAFAAAYARLREGDRRAFAAPLSDSFHDIWMELHQDLMSTLSRERGAGDGH